MEPKDELEQNGAKLEQNGAKLEQSGINLEYRDTVPRFYVDSALVPHTRIKITRPLLNAPMMLDTLCGRTSDFRWPLLSIFIANTIAYVLSALRHADTSRFYIINGDSLTLHTQHIGMFKGRVNSPPNSIYPRILDAFGALKTTYVAVALLNDGPIAQLYFILMIPMHIITDKFPQLAHIPYFMSMGHKLNRNDGTRHVYGLMDIVRVFGDGMEKALLGAMTSATLDEPIIA